MKNSLLVKISRGGKEIGTFEAREAIRLLREKQLNETDFYWHQGMDKWEPLARLVLPTDEGLAAANGQKFESPAKAKGEQAKATSPRATSAASKEQANYFVCGCCKHAFDRPKDPREFFWMGLVFVLAGVLGPILVTLGLVTGTTLFAKTSLVAEVFGVAGLIMLVTAVLGVCLVLWGLIRLLSSGLRSPFCPSCHSTNYSRPNKSEGTVF